MIAAHAAGESAALSPRTRCGLVGHALPPPFPARIPSSSLYPPPSTLSSPSSMSSPLHFNHKNLICAIIEKDKKYKGEKLTNHPWSLSSSLPDALAVVLLLFNCPILVVALLLVIRPVLAAILLACI
jgi:hypothetical protein